MILTQLQIYTKPNNNLPLSNSLEVRIARSRSFFTVSSFGMGMVILLLVVATQFFKDIT